MAASRAPHPLAEAICELAAPPMPPMWLVLSAQPQHVLFHLRPRRHAAGLEVSSYLAIPEGPLGDTILAERTGLQHAVPGTAAGIRSFCQLLVEHAQWPPADPGAGYAPATLCLKSLNWEEATLSVYPGADVQLSWPAGEQDWRASLPRWPISQAVVANESAAYAGTQQALRQAAGQQGGAAAAAGGRRPDSEPKFRLKYERLRGEAMERLAAALAAQIQLACRWRGTAQPPVAQEQEPAAGH